MLQVLARGTTRRRRTGYKRGHLSPHKPYHAMSQDDRGHSESQPLLVDSRPASPCSSNESGPQPESAAPLNKVSRHDLYWILAGLWSAVFLGAVDGSHVAIALHFKCLSMPCILGTIVATLLAPIGSYFNESNRSSYIGTSYLLSVCCFTPLYGASSVQLQTVHRHH